MSKTFTVMKDEVANMVLDTSAAFKTLAGGWLNDALQDANIRFYWQEMIVNDFTFASVVGTATYDYPSTHTMLRPLKMFNITDGKEIEKWDLRKWWQERGDAYDAAILSSGTPDKYVLDAEQSKIMLDPPPDAVKTYKLVYQKNVSALSGASDVSEITAIEPYLVKDAISNGFAYYKQYDKADWWKQKAELELVKIAGMKNASIEETYQRFPSRGSRYRTGRNLLGDNSYDAL